MMNGRFWDYEKEIFYLEKQNKINLWLSVRKRFIPAELQPLVSEMSVNSIM